MNKASKIQAAANIAADMISDLMGEVAPVAQAAKAAAAPKSEAGLTFREVAVLKAVAASIFADPESGAVPSMTLAVESEVPYGQVKGESKANSPIPGLVASLQKKGAVETYKVKGQTMVEISAVGKEFLEAAQ